MKTEFGMIATVVEETCRKHSEQGITLIGLTIHAEGNGPPFAITLAHPKYPMGRWFQYTFSDLTASNVAQATEYAIETLLFWVAQYRKDNNATPVGK